MQEIDEAIHKAETASLTMEKVKVPVTMDHPEMNSDLKSSPEKVSHFTYQPLMMFVSQ